MKSKKLYYACLSLTLFMLVVFLVINIVNFTMEKNFYGNGPQAEQFNALIAEKVFTSIVSYVVLIIVVGFLMYYNNAKFRKYALIILSLFFMIAPFFGIKVGGSQLDDIGGIPINALSLMYLSLITLLAFYFQTKSKTDIRIKAHEKQMEDLSNARSIATAKRLEELEKEIEELKKK